MATKKTQIQVKRNSNNEFNPGDITLRKGEPFYNIPTGDLFMGDGETTVSNLTPINSDYLVATQVYTNGAHLFEITHSIGNRTYFPILVSFNTGYTVGDTIQIKITGLMPGTASDDKIYNCVLYTMDGNAAPNNAFSQNTVNFLFTKITGDNTAQLFIARSGSGSDPVPCVLTYLANAEGVANVPAPQSFMSGNNVIIATNIPTRVGYTFKGWSENVGSTTGEYQPGTGYPFTTSKTIYAVWEISTANKFYVNYDKNLSGTPKLLDTDVIYNFPENDTWDLTDTVYIAAEIPTVAGFTFSVWKNSADDGTWGAGDIVPDDKKQLGRLNLKAIWNIQTYNFNFYASDTASTTCYNIPNVEYRDAQTLPNPPSAPTSSVEFAGWKYNGNTYAKGTSFKITNTNLPVAQEVKFVAQWKPIGTTEYTITYDGNGQGAQNIPAPVTVSAGGSINLSSAITRSTKATGTESEVIFYDKDSSPISTQSSAKYEKYTFNKWNTKADGSGTAYSAGASYGPVNENATIYATWNSQYYFDKITNIPTAPTIAGKQCTGWWTAPIGGTKVLESNATYYTPTQDSIDLYAQYEAIVYTITLNHDEHCTLGANQVRGTSESTHYVEIYFDPGYTYDTCETLNCTANYDESCDKLEVKFGINTSGTVNVKTKLSEQTITLSGDHCTFNPESPITGVAGSSRIIQVDIEDGYTYNNLTTTNCSADYDPNCQELTVTFGTSNGSVEIIVYGGYTVELSGQHCTFNPTSVIGHTGTSHVSHLTIDSGYSFVRLTQDNCEATRNPDTNDITIKIGDSDGNVIVYTQPNTYTVRYNSDYGTAPTEQSVSTGGSVVVSDATDSMKTSAEAYNRVITKWTKRGTTTTYNFGDTISNITESIILDATTLEVDDTVKIGIGDTGMFTADDTISTYSLVYKYPSTSPNPTITLNGPTIRCTINSGATTGSFYAYKLTLSDADIYIIFKVRPFNITYVSDTYGSPQDNATIIKGDTYTFPAVLSAYNNNALADNKGFKNWKVGTTEYSEESTLVVNSDISVSANTEAFGSIIAEPKSSEIYSLGSSIAIDTVKIIETYCNDDSFTVTKISDTQYRLSVDEYVHDDDWALIKITGKNPKNYYYVKVTISQP